jgi:hypothetical protein
LLETSHSALPLGLRDVARPDTASGARSMNCMWRCEPSCVHMPTLVIIASNTFPYRCVDMKIVCRVSCEQRFPQLFTTS